MRTSLTAKQGQACARGGYIFIPSLLAAEETAYLKISHGNRRTNPQPFV
ncbi:MAG: hypothetical protein QMC46_08540 [Burkholderiaceae bacterium]